MDETLIDLSALVCSSTGGSQLADGDRDGPALSGSARDRACRPQRLPSEAVSVTSIYVGHACLDGYWVMLCWLLRNDQFAAAHKGRMRHQDRISGRPRIVHPRTVRGRFGRVRGGNRLI